MILSEISSFISIDDIVIEDSEKYVHFITHVNKLLQVPNHWKSVIYTSTQIFKSLWKKKNAIDQRFFRILQKDETNTISLSSGINFQARMFQLSEITGNVLFHFQESNKSVMYAGPFTVCHEILLNDRFRQIALNGVQLLYLDNTRANCSVETSVNYVGRQLNSILCKHPGYKILLHLPSFGYEELILGLLSQCPFKISVGKTILFSFQKFSLPFSFEKDLKRADIIIGEENVTAEKIKRRFEQEKRLTVRIVEGNNQLKNFSMESIGLYQINWSPHPSILQMSQIISFVRPIYIKEIYSNMPKLPLFLHELCLRKHKISLQYEYQQHSSQNNDLQMSNQAYMKTKKTKNVKNIMDNKNFNINRSKNLLRNDKQRICLVKLKTLTAEKITNTDLYSSNDENNCEIISVSSSDGKSNYRESRIRLPQRLRGNKKRIVGIVKPNNFLEEKRLETKSGNTLDSESEEMNINDYLQNDGTSMSILSDNDNLDI